MGASDYIAIYAAVVASSLLLWDIHKWLRTERLRLTGSIGSNIMIVEPGNSVSFENKQRYILLSVVNRGSIPCTVTNVILKHHKTILERIWRKASTNAVINHSNEYGYSIPYKLEPHGGEFRSMVLQTDDLIELSNDGWLYIGISHTMSSKPFWCRVQPIEEQK